MIKKETIKQKLESAKRKVSDTNIVYATSNIEYLIKLIKRKNKENPDLSIPLIMSEIENSYKQVAFNTADTSKIVTRSDFCLLRTLTHIQNHPELIFQIIDTSDRSLLISKKECFRYTPNINDSVKELMQDACLNIMSRYNLSTKLRFIKGELSVKERISMQQAILNMITSYQTELKKQMKSSYTYNIAAIAKILDETGCFEKSTERYNRRLRMLGLEELQEKETAQKSNTITLTNMSDWKNPDIVGKLPLETLIMAYAFFTNRFCKEYIAFKKSTFLMEELNFSEKDILTGKIATPEELSSALIKYELLQAEARKKYTQLHKQNASTVISRGFDEVSYDLEYEEPELEEYKQIFDTILPQCSNDLLIDYEKFMKFDNAMEILYQKKDMALDSLIMFLIDRKPKINWGYIEEKTEQGNSIEQKKSMVILGFDLDKFNTSIRLHKSLNELKELIQQCNGTDILPIYNGEEDWFVKDRFGSLTDMNTQVFRMFNNQERKQLKQKASTLSPEDRLYGFVSHLNWLANGAIPKKYKQKNIVHLNTGKVEELNEKLK